MSLWDGFFGRRKVKLSDPANWNLDLGSNAGKSVTQDSTLSLATAWACVRLRSRVVGALPLDLFARGENGRRDVQKDHWLYRLIHISPNADQTAAEFWSGMVACIDLWGNAYAEKVKGTGDRVSALEPMRPDMTTVFRDEQGRRKYKYSPPRGPQRILDEDDVFHLRGFTIGGDVGLSAISYGRHTLGLALAADETASKTFANGLQVSGFVELAAGQKPDKAQREQLVSLFDKFSGSSRAGKVMPLDSGWKFVPLSMNPEDAQLLESRSFNVEEICRWFDTPPILVGHAANGVTAWGTGIEQIMLGWLVFGLDPLLVSIQQAVGKQLIPARERASLYAEYNREGLMRADSKGRAELYSSAAQNGWMVRNEIRQRENLPPVPGGEIATVQSQLIALDQLGKTPPRASQPAPGEPV
jgi:HK97 family phage portal protein